MTKIKICGLFRPCDADFVNDAVPDYAGFVFFEKSRRFVTAQQAKELRGRIDPQIPTVGVFVRAPQQQIVSLCRAGSIQIVQLHGGESAEYIERLRQQLPGVPVWQAFLVRSAEDLAAAQQSTADKVLLDNGFGTGQPFDWSLVSGFSRPFLLAGGLTPQNIPQAVARFHPYGVDISSGVETNGEKDAEKIRLAVAAARGNQTEENDKKGSGE